MVLAESLSWQGRYDDALVALSAVPPAQEAARVVILREEARFWGYGLFDEASAALLAAERVACSPDEAARLRASRAAMSVTAGHMDDGVTLLRSIDRAGRAQAVARRASVALAPTPCSRPVGGPSRNSSHTSPWPMPKAPPLAPWAAAHRPPCTPGCSRCAWPWRSVGDAEVALTIGAAVP